MSVLNKKMPMTSVSLRGKTFNYLFEIDNLRNFSPTKLGVLLCVFLESVKVTARQIAGQDPASIYPRSGLLINTCPPDISRYFKNLENEPSGVFLEF